MKIDITTKQANMILEGLSYLPVRQVLPLMQVIQAVLNAELKRGADEKTDIDSHGAGGDAGAS
jgi:hypothetical protein